MSEQAYAMDHSWAATSAVLEHGDDNEPAPFGACTEPNGDPPELILWGVEANPTDGWM